MEALKKDVDKPLIAILTLNTVAHTVGAILVGVQAKAAYANLYGSTQRTVLGIDFTEDLMVGVVSTLMTILILVASEIIPKTIGATYWRQLANFTAKSLKIMVAVLKWTGLLWILQLFTKLVGGKGHHGSVLSREDFTAMTDIAHEEGVFEKSESTIIKNLLRFDQVLVKDVMTPRAVMKIASEDKTIQDFFDDNKRGAGIRLSGDFHLKLAFASQNSTLIDFMKVLVPKTSLIIAQYEKPGYPSCSHVEHFELLDVISDGDVERAASLMDEHLQHIEDKLNLEDSDDIHDLSRVFANVSKPN